MNMIEKKMTTKEVAEICGVTVKTVIEAAKHFGKIFENGKPTEWTEEELKKVQLVLMKNQVVAGGQKTDNSATKEGLVSTVKLGLVANACLSSPEAWEQFKLLGDDYVAKQKQISQLSNENRVLLEDRAKIKELVTHKYLTATQIKETIMKEYGKNIVVSKAVKRIPIEDNDILYKPFKNGDFTGQQPVYHPNVLDKIRELIEG